MMQGFVSPLAERMRGSVVQVICGRGRNQGGGAGIAWDDRLIVTNAHVAASPHLTVITGDGRALEGVVAARDPQRDLAIIRTRGTNLPPAVAGDPARLRPGAVLFAIGHPFGVPGAVSAGIFQALGPLPRGLDFAALRGRGALPWVQADLRLAPGNSGGPMADTEGRVIGISAMIVGGLALAVPASAVAALVRAA